MQGQNCQPYQFRDLCYFPEATLPENFRIPEFDKYNSRGCPITHLKAYCCDLAQLQADDKLLIRLFQKSLTGPALKWFTSLDMTTIKTWDDLSQAFVEQFSFNLDFISKHEDLVAIRQKPHEPFEEYVGRWRTLASQVKDRPLDEESIEIIIRGAIEALLCLLPITSYASLIRGNSHSAASFPREC